MNHIELMCADGLVAFPIGPHLLQPTLHMISEYELHSPSEIISSTFTDADYEDFISDDCFILNTDDNYAIPPEGISIPHVSRETDNHIDINVGWNDIPQDPYPLPSLDPNTPSHDLPIVLPIDSTTEHLFTSLVDNYKYLVSFFLDEL